MTAPPTAAVTPLPPGPVPPPVAGAPTGRPVDPEFPVSLGEGDALEDAVWVSLTDGVGELVSVSLGVGLAGQEGVGVGVAVAVAVLVAVAVPVELQLEGVLSAAAAPPSTANVTETSRVAVPAATPTAPTLCSFSQLLCRDRRKIVTILGKSG